MSARTIVVEHNGKKYSGQIGQIDSTSLGYEAHGILTASLGFKWEGGGVSVGGFRLDRKREADDYTSTGTAYGLDHIIRFIATIGVESWEHLKGKSAIVLFPFTEGGNTLGERACGVAALDGDRVFIPSEHAAEWREREAVSA